MKSSLNNPENRGKFKLPKEKMFNELPELPNDQSFFSFFEFGQLGRDVVHRATLSIYNHNFRKMIQQTT